MIIKLDHSDYLFDASRICGSIDAEQEGTGLSDDHRKVSTWNKENYKDGSRIMAELQQLYYRFAAMYVKVLWWGVRKRWNQAFCVSVR